jgi:hypothetical protein
MITDFVHLDKEGIESKADELYLLAIDEIEAYAFASKLEKVAQMLKEKTRATIDKLDTDVVREGFKIKISTRPKYAYLETHELTTLETQEKRLTTELKSITALIKNIKDQQIINGEALKISETVVATVV